MNNLNWMESGGGPLLLAATPLLAHWSGTAPSERTAGETDYQRACAVGNEIDTIDLGDAQAVVLGDEPNRTVMFLRASDLLLVRWRWANSEEELLAALRDALDQLSFISAGTFLTVPGEHLLFDSAFSGTEVAESSSVILEASDYAIDTATFEPSSSTSALIHRLRPK